MRFRSLQKALQVLKPMPSPAGMKHFNGNFYALQVRFESATEAQAEFIRAIKAGQNLPARIGILKGRNP